MTFFGTEIFAKYFPLFSIRNFFSVINMTADDNIKPSKADTAAGRNNPVVYSCDFGGKRQLEPISFKPKLPLKKIPTANIILHSLPRGTWDYAQGLIWCKSIYALKVSCK